VESQQAENVLKSKLIEDQIEKTYAVVFETGDEVMSGLLGFAINHKVSASHFTAIGAFESVTVGYFDWSRKDYKRIPIPEQVEVLSLIGDITLSEGGHQVHAHVVVGKSDATAHGGHLIEGRVRPTLEVILVEAPRHLRRKTDRASGLALIDFGTG
jgi:predicted DNA-binding protein with PD1-like motif